MTPIQIIGCIALGAIVIYMLHVMRELGVAGRLASLRFARAPHFEILVRAARHHPNRIVAELDAPLSWQPRVNGREHDTREWSAGAIHNVVCQLAGVLNGQAVSANDRVAIYKENAFDIFLFAAASNWIGAIAAPINANLDPAIAGPYIARLDATVLVTDRNGLARLESAGLQHCGVRTIIVVDGGLEDARTTREGIRIDALCKLLGTPMTAVKASPCGADDIAFIFHTSGTTGVPKGVMVSAGGLVQALRSVLKFNLVSKRDHAYFALPMNHQVAHLYTYAVLLLGLRTCFGTRMDPVHALQTIADRRVTAFFGFPITFTRMMACDPSRYDLSSIRIWGTTADAIHEVQQREFVKYGSFFRRLCIPRDGAVFSDGLGSTEVGIAALWRLVTPWTRKYGRRVGRPTPGGPRVKVVDEAGRPVARSQPGRLMIKGPAMFRGYWNAHDLLMKASRDGWWFTGDIVMQLPEGDFVHLDREVDVIHGKAHLTYTLPIEEALLKHPAVLDVSVFGVINADGTAVPAAVVALHSGVPAEAGARLRDEWNAMLPSRDRLAHVWIEDWASFPIGATGKTLRRKLRERYPGLPEFKEHVPAANAGDA